MATSLHYKFGLGDEVKLICRPADTSSIYCCALFDNNLPDTIYKISGWGWVEEELGVFKQYYRLDAYCDKYLNYDNRIAEEEIIPVGETHPFDDTELVYKSVNGDEIKIGTTGYSSIYYGGENNTYISPDFTFTEWGTVQKITKFVEKSSVRKEVIMSEEVRNEYNREIKSYEPTQADGHLRTHFPYLLLTKADDNFIKEYVKSLGKRRIKAALTDPKHHDYHCIKSWLENMGVYEEVCKLAKRGSKSSSTKTTKPKKEKQPTSKKKDKLEELLNGLSDADKKRLKEMLK